MSTPSSRSATPRHRFQWQALRPVTPIRTTSRVTTPSDLPICAWSNSSRRNEPRRTLQNQSAKRAEAYTTASNARDLLPVFLHRIGHNASSPKSNCPGSATIGGVTLAEFKRTTSESEAPRNAVCSTPRSLARRQRRLGFRAQGRAGHRRRDRRVDTRLPASERGRPCERRVLVSPRAEAGVSKQPRGRVGRNCDGAAGSAALTNCEPRIANRESLLVSQRNNRIDLAGAPRGNPDRKQRDNREQDWHARQTPRDPAPSRR